MLKIEFQHEEGVKISLKDKESDSNETVSEHHSTASSTLAAAEGE